MAMLFARSAWRNGLAKRSGTAALRRLSSLPEGATVLPLPALSPTMSSGSIATWHVKEQTEFQAGTVLCEIETDKATVDYEAVDDGVLAKILLGEGSRDISVGTPMAVVAEDLEIAAKINGMDLSFLTGEKKPSSSSADSSSNDQNSKSAVSDHPSPNGSTVASPAAAILLATYGVNKSSVTASQVFPSGKAKIITKGDALKAVQGKERVPIAKPQGMQVAQPPATKQTPIPSATQKPQPSSVQVSTPSLDEISAGGKNQFEDVDLTSMRKVIASRLTEAKQTRPHFYATIECEIDKILSFRSQLKKSLGAAPSINDVIVRAAALSLRDVPRVNCRLNDDGTIVQNKTIDVAVAVATPTGLITPIVKNTDQKGVLRISEDMKDLATRAKANKLKLDEFQGGSFTVSNLGMFGIADFTAVISPPQSAILAVGGGRQEYDCSDESNLRPVNVITVQISCDRRVIDDLTAGQFLQCFKAYMEEPLLMNL